MIKGVLIDKPFHKHRVYINGKQLSWKKSMEYIQRSYGFNWGYGGAGPSQLAFALLLELTNEKIAYALHGTFEKEFIQKLPLGKNFAVTEKEVRAVIERCAKTPHTFPYISHAEKFQQKAN